MAEKEPFCQAILRTHFPDAELFGDVSYVTKSTARAVDVLTAGFPCQDLSVAGKRAGLGGTRSGLFWEVVRILGELSPAWFVLENVPGLFSSCEGRDFAIVLNALDELGYGLAWRVLNSQFFGVAQRRRRVFIVGRAGEKCPISVLFEPEGGGGDIEAGGEAGKDVAIPLTSGAGVTDSSAGRRCEDDHNLALAYCLREDPGGIGQGPNTTYAITGNMRNRSQGPANYVWSATPSDTDTPCQLSKPQNPANFVARALANSGVSSGYRFDPNGEEYIVEPRAPAGDEHHNLTVASLSGMGSGGPDDNDGSHGKPSGSDRATHVISAPSDSHRVRSFASLPEGLDSALPAGMDSARYRALGNAVTASVSKWIGRRILAIESGSAPL
jgi:DNA (cytosine-5)-methyltransferase 1